MKILLVAHGYPPELLGGTEKSVQATARGLARLGHDVSVVAGSVRWEEGFRTSRDVDADPESTRSFPVYRIHRDDLYFDHWQKSRSTNVGRAFRDVLREERPDVVHVHHWIRLSRDLVAIAAQEGIPAVVTLHDLWVSCLVLSRIRPDSGEFCHVVPATDPCVSCAELVPPRTPWLSRDEEGVEFERRLADLRRELTLARSILCLSHSHAEQIERYLKLDAAGVCLEPLVLGRDHRPEPAPRIPSARELGRLVLGTWGTLTPLKGVDLVLDALAALPPGIPVELHVAGQETDDVFAAEVYEKAKGRPVHLHGSFDENGLTDHPVTAVHAMVSGTRAEETWGLVVDEALALRLPMILPRSGAYPEHFPDGEGVIFYEPRDVGSLAAAIDQLRRQPDLIESMRFSLPVVTDVVPRVSVYAERLTEVYAEAVRAGPPAAPRRDERDEEEAARAIEEWDQQLKNVDPSDAGFEAS